MKRRQFLKKGTAGVAGVATASAFAAPAIAQKRVEMVIVSTWPRDFPGLGTGAQRLAKRIDDMSDGRIKVQYYAAKERVGAFASFDEVASGNAQAYHAADYYWKGKHPGWAYFTAVPFGLTYTEMNAWIRFGGGQQLWDELEELLVTADVGLATTEKLIEAVRDRVREENVISPEDAVEVLKREMVGLLSSNGSTSRLEVDTLPLVLLVAGVNGVGKTTSIAKLARSFKDDDKRVILGAADTFRAAAIDQLQAWGQRIDIDVMSVKKSDQQNAGQGRRNAAGSQNKCKFVTDASLAGVLA